MYDRSDGERVKYGVVSGVAIGGTAYAAKYDYNASTLVRITRTAVTAIDIGRTYKTMLYSKDWDTNSSEYLEVKSEAHKISAEKLLELCKANKGAYIKVGQHVGALDYLLPNEYVTTMRVLHKDAPQNSVEELYKVIKEDLNEDPNNLFSEFDTEPLGTASLAQVHRAKLKDGTEVAVKVQHHFVRKNIQIDITWMELVLKAMAKIFPEFQMQWLIDETRKNIMKELDFLQEGRNAEKVAKMFTNYSWLRVPKIFWDYSTERVLVMEYKHKIDKADLCRKLGDLYSHMIFISGFVHSDPHPGNILVRKDPGAKDVTVFLLDHDVRHQDAILYHVKECILGRSVSEASVEEEAEVDVKSGATKATAKAPKDKEVKKKVEAPKVKFEMKLSGDTILASTGRLVPFETIGDRPPDLGEIIVLVSSNNLPASDDLPIVFVNIEALFGVPVDTFKKLKISQLYTKWSLGGEEHCSEPQFFKANKELNFNDHHAVPLPCDVAFQIISDFLDTCFQIELRGIRYVQKSDDCPKFFGYDKEDRDFGIVAPKKPPNDETDIIIATTKIDVRSLAKGFNVLIRGEFDLYPPSLSVENIGREAVCSNDINGIRSPVKPEMVVQSYIILEAQMTLQVCMGFVGCRPHRLQRSYSRMFCLVKKTDVIMAMLRQVTELNDEIALSMLPDELLTGFSLDIGDTVIFYAEGLKDGAILKIAITGTRRRRRPSKKDCSMLLKRNQLLSKSSGIVTTARITHATPAALYAHAPSRYWEDDSRVPPTVRKDCKDIAMQLVENEPGRMTPDPEHPSREGRRLDGRNLAEDWAREKKRRRLRAQYIHTKDQLAKLDSRSVDYLLGLFEYSHMEFNAERGTATDAEEGTSSGSTVKADDPSLADMTRAALSILLKNDKGFFLLIEGGRIDHAHHYNNPYRALDETLELETALLAALERVNPAETLIVVTADHGHVMTFANSSITSADAVHAAAVPRQWATHGGEDVPIYALGPMATILFAGVVEQSYIPHAIAYAACLAHQSRRCQEKTNFTQPQVQLPKCVAPEVSSVAADDNRDASGGRRVVVASSVMSDERVTRSDAHKPPLNLIISVIVTFSTVQLIIN
ncbi:hypothetical protein MSG28_009634 [Choristoneura fumiferana]|uniref:Uncharacterized protein n=1 Tax=Choristoneura fumiferana TaxID=7141 RepID=A0ACC0JC39_CHOFU|nr:hypothetical protein MSG28_009634 [Choristoneura fumiferana]